MLLCSGHGSEIFKPDFRAIIGSNRHSYGGSSCPVDTLSNDTPSEKSEVIRERVIAARKIQEIRFANSENIHCNAQMTTKHLRELCKLNEVGLQLLKTAITKLNLSARAYDRIIKVSRTIADLDGKADIQNEHLAEAIHYRSLDRENWGN